MDGVKLWQRHGSELRCGTRSLAVHTWCGLAEMCEGMSGNGTDNAWRRLAALLVGRVARFSQEFAKERMDEAARLRRRAHNFEMASGQGSAALREQVMTLAKQVEDYRVAQQSASSKQVRTRTGAAFGTDACSRVARFPPLLLRRSRSTLQHAMEAFMRKQHILNEYQKYANEASGVPELFDYGCGEDLDGNPFTYHESAVAEVQTDTVEFTDDPDAQVAIDTQREEAVATALEEAHEKYKLLLLQAKKDAVCTRPCLACGTPCGEQPQPGQQDAADEDEEKVDEAVTLASLPGGTCLRRLLFLPCAARCVALNTPHQTAHPICNTAKRGFKPPATWLKFLGLSAKTKRVKGKLMPPRSFHMLMLQVYQEKVLADRSAVTEGTPPQEMPDYVVNFMLFKFGTRKLVQQRVSR